MPLGCFEQRVGIGARSAVERPGQRAEAGEQRVVDVGTGGGSHRTAMVEVASSWSASTTRAASTARTMRRCRRRRQTAGQQAGQGPLIRLARLARLTRHIARLIGVPRAGREAGADLDRGRRRPSPPVAAPCGPPSRAGGPIATGRVRRQSAPPSGCGRAPRSLEGPGRSRVGTTPTGRRARSIPRRSPPPPRTRPSRPVRGRCGPDRQGPFSVSWVTDVVMVAIRVSTARDCRERRASRSTSSTSNRLPPPGGRRVRAEEPAAHVGVERVHLHAQPAGGLLALEHAFQGPVSPVCPVRAPRPTWDPMPLTELQY